MYLVEGIVPKDRRVGFDDMDSGNVEETNLEEIADTGGEESESMFSREAV